MEKTVKLNYKEYQDTLKNLDRYKEIAESNGKLIIEGHSYMGYYRNLVEYIGVDEAVLKLKGIIELNKDATDGYSRAILDLKTERDLLKRSKKELSDKLDRFRWVSYLTGMGAGIGLWSLLYYFI